MPKPTIVLVHGAWADGASWNAVSTELQVRASPSSLRPTCSTGWRRRRYVASFVAQRTTGPVVLVGHSYGGVVITNAGSGGDVKALVYVDAFIPEVGETVFQILGGSGSASTFPTRPCRHRRLSRSSGRRRRGVSQTIDRPRRLRSGPLRGGPVADRRQSASDHARRQHRGDGDGRLEDHTELGRGRHRGSGHTPCHATQHGGAGGLDDHRSGGIARIDGVPSGGRHRRHPRRRRRHRRIGRDCQAWPPRWPRETEAGVRRRHPPGKAPTPAVKAAHFFQRAARLPPSSAGSAGSAV